MGPEGITQTIHMPNGQEITISAVYKNKTYACSTGKFIANIE